MRDGEITVSDLVGKLEMLRVECYKCGRAGQYRISTLVDTIGADGKIIEWFHNLTMTTCWRKQANEYRDQCGARMPDLSRLRL
jgi:hypothetical protein